MWPYLTLTFISWLFPSLWNYFIEILTTCICIILHVDFYFDLELDVLICFLCGSYTKSRFESTFYYWHLLTLWCFNGIQVRSSWPSSCKKHFTWKQETFIQHSGHQSFFSLFSLWSLRVCILEYFVNKGLT